MYTCRGLFAIDTQYYVRSGRVSPADACSNQCGTGVRPAVLSGVVAL